MTTVFISWSGQKSHEAALIIRKWLPLVIQSVDPYVSSEDIEKGKRWNDDVAAKLEKSGFGVLCLTKDALSSDWMQFEAGALSKMVSTSRVVPILIGIGTSDVKYPLAQFQMVSLIKDDFLKFIRSLNNTLIVPLSEEILLASFDSWWHMIDNLISIAAKDRHGELEINAAKEDKVDSVLEKLEDMISVFRGVENIISDPRRILPEDYVVSVLSRMRPMTGIGIGEISDARDSETYRIIKRLEQSINIILNVFSKLNKESKATMKASITDFLKEMLNDTNLLDARLTRALRGNVGDALEYVQSGRHSGPGL